MPKISRDGVSFYYQEAGVGRPIVFLHGATCDHTFMQPQFDYFQKDHRVVCFDLRGHGQSDKPRQKYTMAGFADDVAWLCAQLDLGKAAVVGHSMGGSVALQLAQDFPELVSAVVALDTTVIPSKERLKKTLPALLQNLRGPDYREVYRRHFSAAFEPSDDPGRKTAILDTMCSAPQYVMISLVEEFGVWDGAEASAGLKVPYLYIAASAFRTDLNILREICPRLTTAQVVGSGHFVTLEVPQQVNPMLERFFHCANV